MIGKDIKIVTEYNELKTFNINKSLINGPFFNPLTDIKQKSPPTLKN